MEAATALALASPSTPLANQVGGHQGVMADASGSLVIKVGHMYPSLYQISRCCLKRSKAEKSHHTPQRTDFQPALAREIAFYQLLNESSRSQPIHKLKRFLPRFFGTLRLEGRMQGDGTLKEDIPEKAEVPEVGLYYSGRRTVA
jgi:1D-myo-inositol-tetrakisphosphate 5-kinase/inositol-polyphosphate multikinase